MEQELSVLTQALNKANQSGAFTLNESSMVANALNAVTQYVKNNEQRKGMEKKMTPLSELETQGEREDTEKVAEKSNN